MIATTLEMSKHLLELGIGPKTADMTYEKIAIGNNFPEDLQYRLCLTPFRFYSGIGVPAWSLSALLELMPEQVGEYSFEIQKDSYGYIVSYSDFPFHGEKDDLCDFIGETAIEATYKMACWLLKHKKI